jgi:DNA-directed RNA polymerase
LSIDLVEIQKQREEQAIVDGRNAYWKQLDRLESKGKGSLSTTSVTTLSTYRRTVTARVAQIQAQVNKTGPAWNKTVAYILSGYDAEEIAVFTLVFVLDNLSTPRHWRVLGTKLGNKIHDEFRFRAMRAHDPAKFDHANKNMVAADRMSFEHRETKMIEAMELLNFSWEKWAPQHKIMVGTALIKAVEEATGIIEIRKSRTSGGKYAYTVYPSTAYTEWLQECHKNREYLRPSRIPMVCEPNDHTEERDGGYLSPRLRTGFVKKSYDCGRVVQMPSKCQPVYDSINRLQKVRWKINSPVFETVRDLLDSGEEVPGCGGLHKYPYPKKLPDGSSHVERRAQAIRIQTLVKKNHQLEGHRNRALWTMATAMLMHGSEFYFPYFLDHRSRVYASTPSLSPQGNDLSKGLLTFSEEKAITEPGMWWLHIHLANCFGEDKVPYLDRVKWAGQNMRMIERIGADPLRCQDWREAGSPFQFLAACVELHNAKKYGVSSLPIMVDGSNNGCQHLAALTLDASVGKLVNVLPSSTPQDVYGVGAEAVKAEVIRRLEKPCERRAQNDNLMWTAEQERRIAQEWLEYGIDRGLTKRPYMVQPYGGTRNSCKDYIYAHVHKRVMENVTWQHPFESLSLAVRWMTEVVWNSMETVLAGPQDFMRWARTVSRRLTSANRPMVWRTPTGFLVHQGRMKNTRKEVNLLADNRKYKFWMYQQTDKLDHSRQANAFAPNYIHSLDASAMHLTVNRLGDMGINSIATVHDCYGTHAEDMDTLQRVLREEFVSMYQQDPLGQLMNDLQFTGLDLPEPPVIGDMDVSQALHSPYFFA